MVLRGNQTFLEAAEAVLRRFSPGAPMHYARITELAVSEGLLDTRGATPAQTMNAQINTDIQRRKRQTKDPRFEAYGRGMYGLAHAVDPLGGAIDTNNAHVRKRLRRSLHEMDPRAFEELIGTLLTSLGFEDVEVTKYSGDGGIDVRAVLTVGGVTDVRTAVQVKRWSNNVAGKTVRELRGGLGPHERGLIITLSRFTRDAHDEGEAPDRTPITLIDGDRLIDLLVDNGIGVTSRGVSILELDEDALSLSLDEAPADEPGSGDQPRTAERGRYMGGKALSTWPLPGGRLAWKATLDAMLRYVAEHAPKMTEAIGWMIQSYDRVANPRVARGYWDSVLKPFGLVRADGERLVATADGAGYLDDPTQEALLAVIVDHVAGFEEILTHLETTSGTPTDLLDLLRETLGVAWETDTQVKFRLQWLENLGVVVEDKGRWHLSEFMGARWEPNITSNEGAANV